jgi:hypothetical protein
MTFYDTVTVFLYTDFVKEQNETILGSFIIGWVGSGWV